MKSKQVSILGVTLVAALVSIGCSRQDAPVTATDPNLVTPPPTANSTTAPAATPAGTPSGVRTLDPQPPAATPVTERRIINGQSVSSRTASTPTYVVKKRSKKKSAAIIGGSAAAGAAIGALAGGGKGAAIGAITGGVAGTVYDRTTAKKKERIE